MEMNEKVVNFETNADVISQQSIVNVLKTHKYTFTSIAEGYHTLFYCIIKCPKSDGVKGWMHKYFGWMGISNPTARYADYPLSLHYYDCDNLSVDTPMVFTQEEVKALIADAQENYVGEDVL